MRVGWLRRELPYICERLIGFSVPASDHFLIVSYEATHIVRLGADIAVEHDERFAEYEIYDPDVGIARYQGRDYSIIGLFPGNPLLSSPQGETLVLEPGALWVRADGEADIFFPFENASGDWETATFSPDGNWILLGCPYDFDFVLLEREG